VSATELTAWFPVSMKPKRAGEYEGRERRTRQRIPVHWRKLDDTDHFDWYVHKGFLGPFSLWESVSHKITSWRGLAQPWSGDKT
jgi:hypothetical protein